MLHSTCKDILRILRVKPHPFNNNDREDTAVKYTASIGNKQMFSGNTRDWTQSYVFSALTLRVSFLAIIIWFMV